MIKVITGIRRCGKSYLLFEIYHQYLNSIGVDDEHIIELALDDDENIRYRNPIELGEYIRSLLVDKDKMYYTAETTSAIPILGLKYKYKTLLDMDYPMYPTDSFLRSMHRFGYIT